MEEEATEFLLLSQTAKKQCNEGHAQLSLQPSLHCSLLGAQCQVPYNTMRTQAQIFIEALPQALRIEKWTKLIRNLCPYKTYLVLEKERL